MSMSTTMKKSGRSRHSPSNTRSPGLLRHEPSQHSQNRAPDGLPQFQDLSPAFRSYLSMLTGCEVVVHLVSGREYKGILGATNHDCTIIIFEAGVQSENTEENVQNVVKMLSIASKDILRISIENESSGDLLSRLGAAGSNHFTDRAIAESSHAASNGSPPKHDLVPFYDGDPVGEMALEESNNGDSAWGAADMFKSNEDKGCISSYKDDNSQYTNIPVPKVTDEIGRRRLERAERVAKEIQSSASYQQKKKLEDLPDEEDAFSAVSRSKSSSSSTGRYVVPHLRNQSNEGRVSAAQPSHRENIHREHTSREPKPPLSDVQSSTRQSPSESKPASRQSSIESQAKGSNPVSPTTKAPPPARNSRSDLKEWNSKFKLVVKDGDSADKTDVKTNSGSVEKTSAAQSKPPVSESTQTKSAQSNQQPSSAQSSPHTALTKTGSAGQSPLTHTSSGPMVGQPPQPAPTQAPQVAAAAPPSDVEPQQTAEKPPTKAGVSRASTSRKTSESSDSVKPDILTKSTLNPSAMEFKPRSQPATSAQPTTPQTASSQSAVVQPSPTPPRPGSTTSAGSAVPGMIVQPVVSSPPQAYSVNGQFVMAQPQLLLQGGMAAQKTNKAVASAHGPRASAPPTYSYVGHPVIATNNLGYLLGPNTVLGAQNLAGANTQQAAAVNRLIQPGAYPAHQHAAAAAEYASASLAQEASTQANVQAAMVGPGAQPSLMQNPLAGPQMLLVQPQQQQQFQHAAHHAQQQAVANQQQQQQQNPTPSHTPTATNPHHYFYQPQQQQQLPSSPQTSGVPGQQQGAGPMVNIPPSSAVHQQQASNNMGFAQPKGHNFPQHMNQGASAVNMLPGGPMLQGASSGVQNPQYVFVPNSVGAHRPPANQHPPPTGHPQPYLQGGHMSVPQQQGQHGAQGGMAPQQNPGMHPQLHAGMPYPPPAGPGGYGSGMYAQHQQHQQQ